MDIETMAYRALLEAGYQHVRRYAGGLSDWRAAGYPLEGSTVTGADTSRHAPGSVRAPYS